MTDSSVFCYYNIYFHYSVSIFTSYLITMSKLQIPPMTDDVLIFPYKSTSPFKYNDTLYTHILTDNRATKEEISEVLRAIELLIKTSFKATRYSFCIFLILHLLILPPIIVFTQDAGFL